jgi:hypothetical protein
MISARDTSNFVRRLTSLALPGSGIPYYKGGRPSAEPTLLTLLVLRAAGLPEREMKFLLSWVSTLQNPDGSTGINPDDRYQGLWLTALSAIIFHHFGLKDPRDRARGFITSLKSVTVANDPNLRQDNTLTGWPWVPGTFGWVEPTAWSVIALNIMGLEEHPRAVEGCRFLLDRQIPSGGWNYGNPNLNDRELLPFWDTTGLALIALHGKTEILRVRASLDLLEKNVEKIESLCGLAWAVLSLDSYERNAVRLKERLFGIMNALPDDELNAVHFAAGLLALTSKKVFVL